MTNCLVNQAKTMTGLSLEVHRKKWKPKILRPLVKTFPSFYIPKQKKNMPWHELKEKQGKATKALRFTHPKMLRWKKIWHDAI